MRPTSPPSSPTCTPSTSRSACRTRPRSPSRSWVRRGPTAHGPTRSRWTWNGRTPSPPAGVTSANETVWGSQSSSSCPNGVCGTGGGQSIRLAKPVWQATVQGSSRSIPDVSMLADPYTGVATYESGAWNGFLMGGTSLATPLWAAMVALLDQGRRARGLANLGVSDTSAWLYSTSGDNFNDVVTGSSPAAPNDSCLQDGSCVAQPGYDLVTGRGSPFMPSLAADVTGTGVSTVKGNYVPVSPQRIMDTRSGAGGVQRAPMGSGQTVQMHLTGAASQASALAVNVAVTNAAGMSTGYVLVYPCGQTRPYASTLNFTAGRTAAVLAQVQVADGCLAVYLNTAGGIGTADVFLDLEGYFSAGSTATVGLYNPLSTPYRAVDTPSGLGGHAGPLGAGEAAPLPVPGRASLKTSTAIPSDAAAVVLNLLAISGTAASYLSVYPAVKGANPCPANLTSSNLNFPPQRVVANRVTTAVGDGGRICFYNSAGRVDITADLSGWYSGGQGDDTKGLYFSAWTPVRIYDTRSAARLGPGTSTCPGANITVPVTPG